MFLIKYENLGQIDGDEFDSLCRFQKNEMFAMKPTKTDLKA